MKLTGNIVKELRLTNKIKQRELSKASGIRPSYLSQIECEVVPLTNQLQERLLAAFKALNIALETES